MKKFNWIQILIKLIRSLGTTTQPKKAEAGVLPTEPKDYGAETKGVELFEKEDGSDIVAEEDEYTETAKAGKQRYCWCISPGHFTTTPGKRSPKFEDGRQVLEWELNHSIADMLCEWMEKSGIAFYRVAYPDAFADGKKLGDEIGRSGRGANLKHRATLANGFQSGLPKVFVAIHANAGPSGGTGWSMARGTETFVHTNAGKKSIALAWAFQTEMVKELGTIQRGTGVKTGNYSVLRNTNMPACLLEVEFFNNKKTAKRMLTKTWREKYLKSLQNAVRIVERDGI